MDSGVIIYKVVMVSIYNNWNNPAVKAVGSDMFATMTASIINAILIMVLERIYGKIVWKLTEKEYPRTDSDFENSYTYKMYIFQFINYYAILFYLAFLQDALSTNPKHDTLLTDRCPPTGCTFSVTMQLAIILTLKQTIGNITEIGGPMVSNWLRRMRNIAETEDNTYTRYEKDFDLTPHNNLPLFSEYFEMVMQFGFITMFVAAFPLAPLFALFNNIVEIRIDARKFVKETRRALPERAADIGNWYDILKFITHLSVVTNGLLIAFTTDVIDRYVYMYSFSNDGSLNGYIEWSLASFRTSDWGKPELMYDEVFKYVTECRYHGYYTDSNQMYSHSSPWWHVMLAKMVFVLVFEHFVFFIMALVQYFVPDVPENVILHMARNRYVNKVAAVRNEMTRMAAAPRKNSQNSSVKSLPLNPPAQPSVQNKISENAAVNSAIKRSSSPRSILKSKQQEHRGSVTISELSAASSSNSSPVSSSKSKEKGKKKK